MLYIYTTKWGTTLKGWWLKVGGHTPLHQKNFFVTAPKAARPAWSSINYDNEQISFSHVQETMKTRWPTSLIASVHQWSSVWLWCHLEFALVTTLWQHNFSLHFRSSNYRILIHCTTAGNAYWASLNFFVCTFKKKKF